jgi:trimeric autotransporter adhesin
MKRIIFCGCHIALALLLLVLASFAPSLQAQTQPLITTPVDESKLVTLAGSRPAALKGATDLGAADESQPSGRLMVTLKRSPEQETALQSFLLSAHQQSSPSYHKWLAPGEFGTRFGAADSDVQQVTAWMQSHGLTVAKVSAGKTSIEFSGTVGQINQAFHTSIHKYTTTNNETHYANATDPQVPAAFSAVVSGVTQLNDFKPTPLVKLMGQAQYNPKTHQGVPQWTIPGGAGEPPVYLLTPEDFATQYDVKPLQAANVTGAGVTIGIINESNIDINLVNAYRALFGLPVNPPQIIIDGNDPGINSAATEAYLDVENAGAVAPGATVKLYIAGTVGLLGEGGINFSMVRAVNDDAASILSLSFLSPESLNPESNNQFFNDLWEQAAAQGQTVMVAAGDTGSVAELLLGLSVNGYASTAWNMAVGGTDAYFGDYATGGASIASYWSNANDANLGSLQKPMSEQPWNGSNYGLNSTTYDPVANQPLTQAGGGGGASSCAMSSPGVPDIFGFTLPVCISGWPKPSWQVGPGVPNDKVRDLPDVSLFASNGFNGVIWPICASPGDCSETNPASGQPLITAVGGTSASSPAMAGILALIEQKYGPQGQANYTLYPMARQFPTAFNDITVGSNNQPCTGFTSFVAFGLLDGCSPDTNGDGFDSFQLYSATAGYDQASGLGTVDVNQLYTNWGKITYAPSSTTLSLTPTTSTHGQSVLASVTVTGNGVPSGPVALVGSTPLPNNKGLDALVLGSNGSVQQALTTLPGGTYTITAQFNGDGINGPSQSQPVSVTVAPEASTVTLSAVYENYPGTFPGMPISITPTSIAAGSSVPYGSDILLDVAIASTSGSEGPPTGTVTFSNGSTVLGTTAVNVVGAAEFNASFLPPGSYTITATYNGDPSYKASTSAPFQFTITQVASTLAIWPDALIANITEPGGAVGVPLLAGTTFGYIVGNIPSIEAYVAGNSVFTGAQPTGTMSFQLGSNVPVIVPLIPDTGSQTEDGLTPTTGAAIQAFPNLAVGTYPLIISYSGDANFSPATITDSITVAAAPAGAGLPSTTTLTSNPANLSAVEPGTLITFTMTVTGSGTAAPTGKVFLSNNSSTNDGAFSLVPGNGNTSTATVTTLASSVGLGNSFLNAIFFGDSNYAGSESSFTSINSDPTDFNFSTLTPNVAIQSGSTGTAMISLGSVNGFNSTVALTCAAPGALICTFTNATVNLNGMTTANVTINTVTPGTAAAAANHPAQAKPFGRIAGAVFACMLLIVLPRRRRFGQMIVSVLVMAVLLTAAGCHQALPPNPTVTTPTAPPPVDAANGTYNVVVTGTASNGIVHNTTITVIVQ